MSSATLLAPLGGDFGAARAVVLVLVGAACGAVGVWVLHFGNAILAESFTHALLPGLVLAAMLGAGLTLGALAGVGAAYLLLLVAMRAPRTSVQSAHSTSVTTLLASGALLATGGSGIEGFEHLLFGDPLAVTTGDVISAAALAAGIAVALIALHGQFTALAFDSGAAPSLGVSAGAVSAAALALLAVSVAVAANVLGSLLALALVTGPAFAAAALARRIAVSLLLAAVIGAATAIGGLYLSYYADLPAGASIALVICSAAVLAATGSALRGGRARLG